MAYTDLDSIHTPTAGTRPPASWGAAVNDNFDFVYDEFLSKLGQWTDYTPSLAQPGAVTKTVTYARYLKIGRLVAVIGSLAVTGTGTGSNSVVIGLPHAAAAGSLTLIGFVQIRDDTASTDYVGVPALASTLTIVGKAHNTAQNLGVSSFSAGLASGDVVKFGAVYESAS